VRTTIRIDDELLRTAKLRAAESHKTLASVIEDALRLALRPHPPGAPRRRVSIPTFGGDGLQPGVDLDDTSSLLDLMEGRK
jgi:hypothetical protein